MPWVYVRPEGHKVPGVLSLRCPVCGRVGPAKEMARRMERAAAAPVGQVAMLQLPGGRGRMSRATRLDLRQLMAIADQGDVRAVAAMRGLRVAAAALLWLEVLQGGVAAPAMQRWAATAAHDVTRARPALVQAGGIASAGPMPLRAVDVSAGAARVRGGGIDG